MSAFAVEPADRPAPDLVAAVTALAEAADTADGVAPLSEATLLALRHGDGAHLVARSGADLVGYAHLAGGGAEWVVHPAWRRRGIGRGLAEAALAASGGDAGPRLAVWAHGDHPAASALALRLGFARVRELWQMRRPLSDDVEAPRWADGVRLRAFRPDADDEAWLRLNARAFADHPEQGRWTAADLLRRRAEPWFDPAGLLLAERVADGALLGFHWTKVHTRAGAPPLGEVYVLGVDPAGHGRGLGRALTLAGLRHLRGRGVAQVMLYVDESNGAATALYARLGFARHTTDVQYRR
ncbi:mycothiol acetyltransferase [Pilimelia terevasa]|uniref:Mycothiol acetyltransferase n=1 Tax=Pilimelia terevasa TaxID=53372 RepID=A0A8J3BKU7_9ACTN|nr:mycothiol synthase [Pilimelia terevasa]GGK29643.1 mycothiol acetyltransferase [Pilimelia terevasa]